MKIPVLASALIAAVALAAPSDAAAKKRKPQQTAASVPATKTVFNVDRVVGADPDPFIRAMIQKDPTPGRGAD